MSGHVSRSHSVTLQQSINGGKGIQKRKELGQFGKGKYFHTEATKLKLSELACTRLAKHSKYTRNVEYKEGVILESSYEVRTAEILDDLKIEWVRVRKGYTWDDNGKIRRYIPDFYLPTYDLFLDPKNDYLIKKDARKIASACKRNGIKVVVLSNSEITKAHIEKMLPSTGMCGEVL